MRESFFWFLQPLTALAMCFFLVGHMVLMHLDRVLGFLGIEVGDVLRYEAVMGRGASTFWLVFYLLFLAVALYHGLYGLRGIILEWIGKKKFDALVTVLILAVGAIAFAYGAFVTVKTFTG